MNAPFRPMPGLIRLADLGDELERRRYEAFVAQCPSATPFHQIQWLDAVDSGTGNRCHLLLAESHGEIVAALPLSEVHSPIFGRLLASSGFGVGGGILSIDHESAAPLFAAAEELANKLSCPTIELRGGLLPDDRQGWSVREDSHCGFVAPLAMSDEAQLLAIPRKQRAEVRKGLDNPLSVTVGRLAADRAAHYRVYAESVRNLGTPVFPHTLFDAVLDRFAGNADILTVYSGGEPVSSVLSLYHRGAVMPYWGGGTRAARHLRANDRMYFALMLHARERGCDRFDFGRSKTGSGAWQFKRNWGFLPEPLAYASWTAPGAERRDADPNSSKHAWQIAIWQHIPLMLANRLGPWIARGLG